MAKGPAEYDLTKLTSQQFEALTFLLAREQFPEVVQVRQKDFGLDARLPTARGATTRGWQAKRYTGKIHWDQCQESLRRALAFWRPLRVTFAFPKILSGKEQKDFKRFLIDEFPRVTVDWWDASELQARMRESEGGRRAASWLFTHPDADKEELRRVLAVGGELADGAHAAARVAEVQKFMSRDPHLRYTTVASERDGPTAPHAQETIISMEAEIDEMRVRFDASERYPGAAVDAGLGGKLIFSDDEDGRRARAAFDQVSRDGGAVEITSGMAADFGSVPVGLRGLMPEEPVSGSFEISVVDRAREPELPTLPVLVRAGEVEIGLTLGPTDPPEGWSGAVAGSAGGLQVIMAMRGRDVPTESRLEWRWQRGEGTAAEQLLAAEVVLAAYRGAAVQVVNPSDEKVVVSAVMDHPDDPDAQIRELESICDFLRYVAEAEAALGAPLEPPEYPAEEDLRVLSSLLGRLRRRKAEGTWTRVELVLSRLPAYGGGPFAALLLRPLYGPLFGKERYLGLERVYLPEGRIEDFRGDERAGDTVAIVPAKPPGKVQVEYHPPTEASEELATGGPKRGQQATE